MLPNFAKSTIAILRPAQKVERGSLVFDFENAERVEIGGCSIQPGENAADIGSVRAAQNTVRYHVFLPPDADILPHDRVEVYGIIYLQEGPPRMWESPTGAVNHKVIHLVDWSG